MNCLVVERLLTIFPLHTVIIDFFVLFCFCLLSVTWLQDGSLKNEGATMHLLWLSGVPCHGLRLERVGHVLGVINRTVDTISVGNVTHFVNKGCVKNA